MHDGDALDNNSHFREITTLTQEKKNCSKIYKRQEMNQPIFGGSQMTGILYLLLSAVCISIENMDFGDIFRRPHRMTDKKFYTVCTVSQ